jgi:hypothetical protein
MLLGQLKIVAVALLVLGLVGSGVGWFSGQSPNRALARAAEARVDDRKEPATPKDAEKGREEPLEEKQAEKEAPPGELAEEEIHQLFNRRINFSGIDDPKATLIEILDQLAKIYRVPFDINEQAFKPQKGVDFDIKQYLLFENALMPPMKASMKTVLERILRRLPVPATFLIRKDGIEITTVAAVRTELGMKANEELLPLVWENFRDQPVAEALDRLRDASGYNVIVDPRVLGKTKETRVTARLTNLPVDTAIRLLADMAGLDVVRRDNAFYITNPENAARLKKEEPKRPLVPEPPIPKKTGA